MHPRLTLADKKGHLQIKLPWFFNHGSIRGLHAQSVQNPRLWKSVNIHHQHMVEDLEGKPPHYLIPTQHSTFSENLSMPRKVAARSSFIFGPNFICSRRQSCEMDVFNSACSGRCFLRNNIISNLWHSHTVLVFVPHRLAAGEPEIPLAWIEGKQQQCHLRGSFRLPPLQHIRQPWCWMLLR